MELSAILDSINDCICGLDAQGNIALANRPFTELLRCPFEHLRGMHLSDLVNKHRPIGAPALSDLHPLEWLDDGIAVSDVEETIWRTDGEPVLVELSIMPISLDMSLHLRSLVCMRRITQTQSTLLGIFRKLIELNSRLAEANFRLAQSEKLAAIGQLAAGMAHEINNPISFVHSNLASLARYATNLFSVIDPIQPDLQPDGIVKLNVLKQQIDYPFLRADILSLIDESQDGLLRVKKIVQDLRSFAGDESSPDLWGWLDINQSIRTVLDLMEGKLKGYLVETDFGVCPEVHCQPSALKQVWHGILLNAIEAISAGGAIHIKTSQQAGRITIEFSDTGCGIPAENLPKIFDPFFTTRPVGKGMGLGLTTATQILLRHDGQISANSTPGKGTTIRVELPLTPRQDKSHA